MRVDFVIIDTDGTHETLACPNCGCVFDIDAHSEENLVFDKIYKGYVAKCPDCKSMQKGDEDEVIS
jgi:uncharacterized C2H2 Zn-finger protein